MRDLNQEQLKAVHTTEGRVLILAGAGTGKTSVLAHRMAHLIQTGRASACNILGLTFTNKAAEEMRHRVAGLIGGKLSKELMLCTFHSFCMQLLRQEIHHLGYTSSFSLYDEKDVKRLVTSLARHLLECDGDLPSLEGTLAKIADAKNRGVQPNASPENATWHDQFSHDLFTRLHSCMRAYNAVDFDSLLSLTVELFEQFPSILQTYQKRYSYILIDEYQDTNPIQYRLSALLSQEHNNLCVVGDDDQSIYGWRGAEIKHILEFEAAHTITLEQNYRSTPTILQAANAVICNNKERHIKELWSSKEQGRTIEVFHAPGEKEEAQAVVARILALRKEHNLLWSDIAILYRSNLLAQTFELALMDAVWEKQGKWIRGIPYQVFGGTSMFERSEIKDLIAYLKTILNPLDQESLLRIINTPRRGISDQTLDTLTALNRSQNIPLWQVLKQEKLPDSLTDKAVKAVRSFVELIQEGQLRFKTDPLKEAMQWLLDTIQYKKAIEEDAKSDKMRAFKWENVMACVDAMGQYEETMRAEEKSDEISLHHFLSHTLLDSGKASYHKKQEKEDKINLMTFHSAKGLEFTACFLVSLEDHIIPHEKSLLDGSLEEERRLMYVAMTRAKKYLTLSMARKRKRLGKEMNSSPSRFLFEIPQTLIEVTNWTI